MNEQYVKFFTLICQNAVHVANQALWLDSLTAEQERVMKEYRDTFGQLLPKVKNNEDLTITDLSYLTVGVDAMYQTIITEYEKYGEQKRLYEESLFPIIREVMTAEHPEEIYKNFFGKTIDNNDKM